MNSKSLPLVSVIIPSYNHKRFILHTIKSFYEQDYPRKELIVIDDGSKDGSSDYLKALQQDFNFQLILKENEGICATLNKGVTISKGEYIVLIASDDYMTKTRLTDQVNFLEGHPDVDVVAGGVYLVDDENNLKGEKKPFLKGQLSLQKMLEINRVIAPSAMLRKNCYERFGLYPSHYLMEDYYYWTKILENGGVIVNTDYIWAYYRLQSQLTEKKMKWYFDGADQVLESYSHVPSVEQYRRNNYFRYMVKLSLISSTAKATENKISLFFYQKLILFSLKWLPRFIKGYILKILKIAL